MKRIPNDTRLQEIQLQQVLCRTGGQKPIFLGRQSRHPKTGLAGNGHSSSRAVDDLANFLQEHCGPIQVHPEDGFNGSLRGGNPSPIDQVFDGAKFLPSCDKGLD